MCRKGDGQGARAHSLSTRGGRFFDWNDVVIGGCDCDSLGHYPHHRQVGTEPLNCVPVGGHWSASRRRHVFGVAVFAVGYTGNRRSASHFVASGRPLHRERHHLVASRPILLLCFASTGRRGANFSLSLFCGPHGDLAVRCLCAGRKSHAKAVSRGFAGDRGGTFALVK